MKDLSIVIISYNTKKLTIDCVKTIVENTKGLDYEILVVDNNSKDKSADAIREYSAKYESKNLKIEVIENDKNLGFAKANNQGMDKSTGKYILFLNSDTKVESNVLKEMVDWMEGHEGVGAATCTLRNKDKSIQGTGGYFPTLPRVFNWMFFIDDIPLIEKFFKPFHPMHDKSPFSKGEAFYKEQKEIDWVTGAFMLTRASVVKKVGGFDEDFFMYTEDTDLCFRIKREGYRIVYTPKWSITHLGGSSSVKEYPLLSEFEGVKLFYKKHMPTWQYPVLRVLLKVGSVLRIFIFGLIKGKEGARVYAKALGKI